MAATGLGADNINAKDPKTGQPIYTERVRNDFASPQLQTALQSGGSSKVKIGETEYTIAGGRIMSMKTGGVVKPLLLAAAIPATVGIAGAFAAPAAAASTLGPTTAASMAATNAAIAVPSSIAATSGAGGLMGLSYADILKYGLPEAGDLVKNYLGNKQAGKQFDASQAYLEQALAYQKEQDAFNRTRQTGLDTQERDRYAYSTSLDAARYGDTQQQWGYGADESANRYGYEADREVSRYGDYSKRIAPYLQSGANANDRMSSLLGLPAGPAFDPTLTAAPRYVATARPTLSSPGTGPSPAQRIATDPATDAAIRSALQAANSNDDFSYWQDKLAAHGDSATKNWQYWQDFINRGDGVGKGYKG